MFKNIFSFLMLIFLVIIVTSSNLYAYLDPGTGSMILQVLAAVGIGLILVLRTFWGRIKLLFRKPKNIDTEEE